MVSLAVLPESGRLDQRCVWAEAGLLAYKHCEHCPLDAALRGAPLTPARPEAHHGSRAEAVRFPDDRLYARTHTWLQPAASGARARVGVDGFAAVLLSEPRRVRHRAGLQRLQKDQAFCVIDLDEGPLPLSVPLAAEITARNVLLDDDPAAVVADPYGEGWIAEIHLPDGNADGAALLRSGAARREARFDDRRFRRRVAFELLADADDPDADADARIGPDLCHMLGPARYLSLIRELVH